MVFIPQKVADRLEEYVKESGAGPEQRLFPISYNAARIMVQLTVVCRKKSFKFSGAERMQCRFSLKRAT